MKAKLCALFSLKAIPYMTLAFILAMAVLPAFKVTFAFVTFFYLIFALTRFSSVEDCQAQCGR